MAATRAYQHRAQPLSAVLRRHIDVLQIQPRPGEEGGIVVKVDGVARGRIVDEAQQRLGRGRVAEHRRTQAIFRRFHLLRQVFVLGNASDEPQDQGNVIRRRGPNRELGPCGQRRLPYCAVPRLLQVLQPTQQRAGALHPRARGCRPLPQVSVRRVEQNIRALRQQRQQPDDVVVGAVPAPGAPGTRRSRPRRGATPRCASAGGRRTPLSTGRCRPAPTRPPARAAAGPLRAGRATSDRAAIP